MSSRVILLYKSRRTLLEQLATRGYDTSEYESTTVGEIDAMLANNQLDMLLHQKETGQSVYVKYPRQSASRQIQQKVLDELIEDLYIIDEVLTPKDTLILLIEDEPNDSLLGKIRTLYDRDGIFIIVQSMQRLQFNILNHTLVPKMTALGESEMKDVMKKLNVRSVKQFPEISRFDPHAQAIGLRPGQVGKIERSSPTALSSTYYRVCV